MYVSSQISVPRGHHEPAAQSSLQQNFYYLRLWESAECSAQDPASTLPFLRRWQQQRSNIFETIRCSRIEAQVKPGHLSISAQLNTHLQNMVKTWWRTPHCNVSEGECCSACLKLREIQSKILECKELLVKLYVQEAHTKSSINAVHVPIIRQLPVELVSNIFILSNPSPVDLDLEGRSSSLLDSLQVATQRYQFSLGAVCTAWRNIVRSTPQLWTNIWIRLQIRGQLPQMEFLLLSLRLSGSLPLHIYAWVPRYHEPLEKDYPTLISLLEALNDHSERWKTLDLCLTSRLMSHIKGVSPGSPNLEQLRIRAPSGSWINNPFHLSFGLPSPRVVNVHEISFQFIGIDWKSATHVRLDRLTVGECLELFRQATQLEDLVISLLECGDSELIEFGEIIIAPNLTSWKVEFDDDSDVLLRKICLPSLVHLEIEEFTSLGSLEHMVSRSNCPLRTISLDHALGAHIDVIPILRMAPLLEKVVLYYAGSHEICELLDILARTKLVGDLSQDPNMTFLPRLESLSFIQVQDYHPPWHLVPSLFPPTQYLVNAHYRPLRKLKFVLIIDDFEDEDYLDKDLVLQLLEIRRRDYDLIIWEEEDAADLIQDSYDHHFGSQTDTADNSGVGDGGEEPGAPS